eukprot:Gb_10961 [translate_table: standard]
MVLLHNIPSLLNMLRPRSIGLQGLYMLLQL